MLAIPAFFSLTTISPWANFAVLCEPFHNFFDSNSLLCHTNQISSGLISSVRSEQESLLSLSLHFQKGTVRQSL